MIRVFIDSDVVISSLLSSTGAAYFLLHQSQISPVISSISLNELRLVAKRMGIKTERLELLIKKRFEVHKMAKKPDIIKREYAQYVIDINDAHIVAGAGETEVKYLISYNIRHYKIDKIRDDLDLLILTPALFLQYLRSQ